MTSSKYSFTPNNSFSSHKLRIAATIVICCIVAAVGLFVLKEYAHTIDNDAKVHTVTIPTNPFDTGITLWLNQFATRSSALDSLMVQLADNNMLKGGFVAVLLWYLWIKSEEQNDERRWRILSTIAMALVAVLVARVLAQLLPYRERPIYTESIHFVIPTNMIQDYLVDWSSLPSDHAAMFMTLAIGIYALSRPLGIIALLHAVVIICFPRLYLGIHWPTDILAGAVLGLVMGGMAQLGGVRSMIKGPVDWLLSRNRALFYSAFFLLTYQMVTLFDDTRHIVSLVLRIISGSSK